MAELYAHVHNLPESAEKRRMFIKRASNHNSVVTPNRSITNSIKVYNKIAINIVLTYLPIFIINFVF